MLARDVLFCRRGTFKGPLWHLFLPRDNGRAWGAWRVVDVLRVITHDNFAVVANLCSDYAVFQIWRQIDG
jgi:hypothetical protein